MSSLQLWMESADRNISSICALVSPSPDANDRRKSLPRLHSEAPVQASCTRPPATNTAASTASSNPASRNAALPFHAGMTGRTDS